MDRPPSSDASDNLAHFAAAHAARSLGWAMTDMLLAWQLHVVVGFSGVATSCLLMVLLSIGALSNIATGYALTALRALPGDYIRLQRIGAVATAVLLAGQFLVRDPVGVVVIAVAFRIGFALQDVPQNALGSLLPAGEADARRYAGLRVTLSNAMRIAAIALHMLLLRAGSPVADGLAFAVIGGLIVASAFRLQGLRFPVTGPTRVRAPSWQGVPAGLPALLFAFAIAGAVLPTLNRLLIFAPASGAGGAAFGSWMLAAFYGGSVVGPLVLRRLTQMSTDRDALRAAILIVVASAALVTFGTEDAVRLVATAAHGIGLSMIGVQLWTRVATVAMRDAGNGPRRDGLIASAVILTTHLSIGLGSLLLAPLIDAYENGDPGAALAALLIVGAGALALMPLRGRRNPVPALA